MSESSSKHKSPPFKNRQPKKIPPTLENLFKQADFIIGVGANQKICFKTQKYFDKSSWWGWGIRNSDSESSTDLIQKITALKDQLFDQYSICRDPDCSDLILTELIELRSTCIRLKDTTYAGSKYTHEEIEFKSLIRAIGIGLPDHVRHRQGISNIGASLYEETPFTEQTESTAAQKGVSTTQQAPLRVNPEPSPSASATSIDGDVEE